MSNPFEEDNPFEDSSPFEEGNSPEDSSIPVQSAGKTVTSIPVEPAFSLPHDYPKIDYKEALNDDQYGAVTAKPGPILVLAGAGSGKTRTLTYRVAWLLEQGYKPSEVLLLTFTNKAAKEMLERVEELTGVPSYKFWGGTFHSLGQKILRVHGALVGLGSNFNIMDQGDAEGVLTEAIRTVNPDYLKKKDNPKAKVIHGMISYARNTRRPVIDVIEDTYQGFRDIKEAVFDFAEMYRKLKLEKQVADYDDLLEYWLLVLNKDAAVAKIYQERFKHILVDEYQDTNSLQSSIIDKLADKDQIMAVGDDAQCIYTWRGAEFTNILTFPQRHKNTAVHKIEINYRSSPEILNMANDILQYDGENAEFKKELRSIRPGTQKPQFIKAHDTRHQAKFVASKIRQAYDSGISLSDIAILYRAHYHAMDVQMELSRQGIPFQITSGVRFFEQSHVKDLTAQLRFACNPNDTTAFQRFVCLLPRVGAKSAERLYKLAQKKAEKENIHIIDALADPDIEKKVPGDAREEWPSLIQTLIDIKSMVALKEAPSEIVRVAIEGWYSQYIRLVYENWDSRMDDLQSIIGFAERFEDMTELLAQLVLLNAETNNRSVEMEEDSVRLTTIHQSKGLEFPVVIVLGLADGLFPTKRAIDAMDVEEERRLFYVASTRAKDELYLVYPKMNMQKGYTLPMEISQFIIELPEHTYDMVKLPTPKSAWKSDRYSRNY